MCARSAIAAAAPRSSAALPSWCAVTTVTSQPCSGSMRANWPIRAAPPPTSGGNTCETTSARRRSRRAAVTSQSPAHSSEQLVTHEPGIVDDAVEHVLEVRHDGREVVVERCCEGVAEVVVETGDDREDDVVARRLAAGSHHERAFVLAEVELGLRDKHEG